MLILYKYLTMSWWIWFEPTPLSRDLHRLTLTKVFSQEKEQRAAAAALQLQKQVQDLCQVVEEEVNAKEVLTMLGVILELQVGEEVTM